MQRFMSHPYLALFNEVVLIIARVSMLLCCFCLIKLNLQLPRSNWEETSTIVEPICFPVCLFEIISLGETLTFNLCFFPFPSLPMWLPIAQHDSLPLSMSLIFDLPFGFQYFLPHSCGAQPDGDENKN